MTRLTLIGLYNYDSNLFQNLSLPEGIDETVAKNTILMNCGEMSLIYPNLTFMESAIGNWSLKWYYSIDRIYKTLIEDYDPLHNYDRYENWTDKNTYSETENIDNTTTANSTTTVNSESDESLSNTNGSTVENTVSAFNSDQYQPAEKNTTSGTNSDTNHRENDETTTGSGSGTDNTDRTLSKSNENIRTGRAYGNIGVTSSVDLLMQELQLRSSNNIYDIIAEIFKKEFCIMVY